MAQQGRTKLFALKPKNTASGNHCDTRGAVLSCVAVVRLCVDRIRGMKWSSRYQIYKRNLPYPIWSAQYKRHLIGTENAAPPVATAVVRQSQPISPICPCFNFPHKFLLIIYLHWLSIVVLNFDPTQYVRLHGFGSRNTQDWYANLGHPRKWYRLLIYVLFYDYTSLKAQTVTGSWHMRKVGFEEILQVGGISSMLHEVRH